MKYILLTVLAVCLFGCAKGDSGSSDSASVSENATCQPQRGSHSGCCSSHGGFGTGCGTGEAKYGDNTGKLMCNDGSYSPTCVY
jgi:hypothetical protein